MSSAQAPCGRGLMLVHVKLVGLFKTGRFVQQDIICRDGTKIEELIERLELPRQHLGIILLNGLHTSSETVLKPKDSVVLMPFVDGG